MASKRKAVWQTHHIIYEKGIPGSVGYEREWTVRVTQGEHWAITQLQRFKKLSIGAVTAIKYILENAERRQDDE